jgi:hypothetical protein
MKIKKMYNRKTGNYIGKVVGEIRQTQLITSFGCGAIVDFVKDTVIIAGTDNWDWDRHEPNNEFIIHNESLQNLLNKDYFVKPKVDVERKVIFAEKSRDIPAYRFPETMYCIKCGRLHNSHVFEHQKQMKCFCKNDVIIPSRFVAICENGHIEDFPYSEWVHQGAKCENPRLYLFNVDGKIGIDNLIIKCMNCNATRSMKGVFAEDALKNIKKCSGNRPWLSEKTGEPCDQVLKARLRFASNVYFPVTISALSIPPWSQRLFTKLKKYAGWFNNNPAEINEILIKTVIAKDLPEYTVEELREAYKELEKNKKHRGKKKQYDIYKDEYLALTKQDMTDEEFSSLTVDVPQKYNSIIKKVIALDRLTEVVAMLGFTRLKQWSGRFDDRRIAPLSSKNKNWLPAVKLNGEGIFIEFHIKELKKWADQKIVQDHYRQMKENLQKSFFQNERYSPLYIFLHTFAHLLIRQLSLECGYGTASIKEKIYSTFVNEENGMEMAGILIYTAAPDSDGSLGGLVEQAEPEKLSRMIDNMIYSARWCSSDPLCISSYGQHAQGVLSLNYAACHACTLLPETSCEFRNLLLDRAALIGLPEKRELGLFNKPEFET